MKVRHGLLTVLTHVEHETVPALAYAFVGHDLFHETKEVLEDAWVSGGDVIHAREVALGNDEYVHRRLRRNVMKGQRGVALGDDLRGNLSRNYFAKKAVTHLVLSSLLTLWPFQRKAPVTSLKGQQ
jgi:hypothetical protein